ncbi:ATP-dependent DNA helicase homolog RECG, chloroplastic isoform X2 [Solanum dulcamara]|uniref:ATP-dependent DNA helicase homolog RECG, chloroplastic isoform X2 n=1 Tax=Solanum dulcamara TaxID=45834 RepID=UPI0024850F71|nr:ATP-dependent DNA helicase homolog RECG, chloroplastic isoform X2 [Solanum dulcamara]
MAVSTFVVQSRTTMCSSDKCLRSALIFEAQKGYWNFMSKNMRFNNFLSSKMWTVFSRSKHKASVVMGYDGLDDLIDGEGTEKQSDIHPDGGEVDYDFSLMCKQFSSIRLGSSPPIELYHGTTSNHGDSGLWATKFCREFLSSSVGEQLISPDSLYETWHILYSGAANMVSTTYIPDTLETETRQDLQFTVDKPSNLPQHGVKQNDGLVEIMLDQSVSFIPGLSKRHSHQLENCGFHTLRKLLQHFPRTYVDLQNAQVGIEDGQYLIFIGKIKSSRGIKASYSLSFLEVVVACDVVDNESPSTSRDDGADLMSDKTGNGRKKTVFLHLKKFFRGTRFTYLPFLKSLEEKQKVGDIVCVSGKVRIMRSKNHYEMREYNMDVLQDEKDPSFCAQGRPYPIYPSKGGLSSNFLRDVISRALKVLPSNIDPIPEDLAHDFGLLCLHDAYAGIHQPKSVKEAELARKRLVFDEFFYLQLGRLFQMLEGLCTKVEKDGLLDKYRKSEFNLINTDGWSMLTRKFLDALPYSLTPSQLRAASEIIWDLKQPVPMNRLLQGDVGCGKTVVAFLACLEVISLGYQAAFMVPTELLAIQHYEQIQNLLANMEAAECKLSVALLTGSTSTKESRLIRQGLQTGDISLVIGTHSLIADKVEFSALRIAVVDEQHRFGVIQRGRFNSKLYYNSISSKISSKISDDSSKDSVIMAPHILAMSATPIPRSLALALYGDMSLTQMMFDELESGGKIYLVYPIIEQSEQLPQLRAASADLETISQKFSGYNCGLLHGKMKGDDKSETLNLFRSGETNILLSTQVIEIGVDIPDASMMVVMNAERFGIAQLHQLRGRVGRGEKKSKCILVASTDSSLSRLQVLEKSSDGFYLANMDLVMRGPGDLLGRKQSGHLPEFPIARLEIDGNIIQDAHLAALKILGDSLDLEKYPNIKAELSMRQPLCLLGD